MAKEKKSSKTKTPTMPERKTRRITDDKILNAINDQIVLEQYSAQYYLAMSAWFEDKGLEGFARWYYIQHQEELDHAMIFYNALHQFGLKPVLGAIDAPPSDYESIEDILEQTYKHEQYITDSIHNIAQIAQECQDFKAITLLDWFIDEQNEEEDNTSSNLERYRLFAKENGQALYSLDNELGQRTYTKPQKLVDYEA